jgi:hypothetical protein
MSNEMFLTGNDYDIAFTQTETTNSGSKVHIAWTQQMETVLVACCHHRKVLFNDGRKLSKEQKFQSVLFDVRNHPYFDDVKSKLNAELIRKKFERMKDKIWDKYFNPKSNLSGLPEHAVEGEKLLYDMIMASENAKEDKKKEKDSKKKDLFIMENHEERILGISQSSTSSSLSLNEASGSSAPSAIKKMKISSPAESLLNEFADTRKDKEQMKKIGERMDKVESKLEAVDGHNLR